nr:M48 family metalloprotease [Pigmentiphaga aceris]
MQGYLTGLLNKIKTQAGVPQWPGEVYVLASPALDAYATAAGNIYVSHTWLASAESEDEIVALLSHEFSHVYLHYHQLEGAIQTGDQAAVLVAVGMTLAKKTANAAGWTQVDSLVAGYALGRELAASAWGRSQESAADELGLKISLLLGYSYEAGFKAFLERQAAWDESNAARQEKAKQAALDEVKAKAAASVMASNKGPRSEVTDVMYSQLAQLHAAFGGIVHSGTQGIGDLWKKSSSTHPETIARMDALAATAESVPPGQISETATVAPWLAAQRSRDTAKTLAHYQLAAKALEDPKAPDAMTYAREAASGTTATHAYPLVALYKVQAAQAASSNNRRLPADPGTTLDANLASTADRAWLSVVERSSQLNSAGKSKQAQQVMDQGFAYFGDAANAWPDAIAFYAPLRGWDEAKRMAQTCSQRFSNMANACRDAAASPADKARSEQLTKQKVDGLLKRLTK